MVAHKRSMRSNRCSGTTQPTAHDGWGFGILGGIGTTAPLAGTCHTTNETISDPPRSIVGFATGRVFAELGAFGTPASATFTKRIG